MICDNCRVTVLDILATIASFDLGVVYTMSLCSQSMSDSDLKQAFYVADCEECRFCECACAYEADMHDAGRLNNVVSFVLWHIALTCST